MLKTPNKRILRHNRNKMNPLKRKYDNFKQRYEKLGKAIAVQEQLQSIAAANIDAKNLFLAGVTQHFKLAYETAWKFLKQYLTEKYGSSAVSPKQIFKECETYRLFPQNVVTELITLADARNTTTHIYDQILAQEVCDSIVKHYQAFGKILEFIKL